MTSADSPPTPAGWYPDPQSTDQRITRYWDGAAWTPHRKAPPGVFIPKPVPKLELRHPGRRGAIIAGGIVACVVLLGTCVIVSNRGDSSAGTTEAVLACQSVVNGAREMAAGSRTPASFQSVLSSAEGRARGAAQVNGKYLPILTAIVSVENDMRAGITPSGLNFLASQCG